MFGLGDKTKVFVVLSIITILLLVVLYLTNLKQQAYYITSKSVIVTGYFPLPNAKHSLSEYDKWMHNFFLNVGKNPLVVYTPKDYVENLRKVSDEVVNSLERNCEIDCQPNVYFVTDYDNPFEFPPIKKWEDELKKEQWEIDPEKNTHNPSLYAIWNAKPFMVADAINRNYFRGASLYFWTDIGSFREEYTPKSFFFTIYPYYVRINELLDKYVKDGQDFLVLEQVHQFDSNNKLNSKADIFAGTWWGGNKNALIWYSKEFYSIMDNRIENKKFAGKDQVLINIIAFLHPTKFHIFNSWTCGTEFGKNWFCFQYLLAPKNYLESKNMKFDENLYLFSDIINE
eukprot:TRINITY_DN4619_c0_g1_i1.p1 TRINITY_DN4619_c0_g1~~TRINITY_DN4619_c0_g1_i1.p1  ORF type:complete len:342 (-),score=10.51 TRINITY_DN4619_c0_g1_i1:144-1169(-)